MRRTEDPFRGSSLAVLQRLQNELGADQVITLERGKRPRSGTADPLSPNDVVAKRFLGVCGLVFELK